jgi:hypothetical protein
MAEVPAHSQVVTRHYLVHYPAHDPRADDPHRADFEAWKRQRKAAGTYHCDFAVAHRGGDTSECDMASPLEAHHKVIELALLNAVDFALLEQDYPGISAQTAGAWIDSDANLTLLCVRHHRGPGGVHTATASDYGSEAYVRDMISEAR